MQILAAEQLGVLLIENLSLNIRNSFYTFADAQGSVFNIKS